MSSDVVVVSPDVEVVAPQGAKDTVVSRPSACRI